MLKFHERLNELKNEQSLTQTAMAAALGISSQSLSYYMNGREPNYELLIKIASFFKVSVDYLLGLSDFKTPAEADDFSEKIKLINERLVNEDTQDKDKLMSIYELIYNAFYDVRDAGLEISKSFLNDMYDLVSCIGICCGDASIIAKVIECQAFNEDATNYVNEIKNTAYATKLDAAVVVNHLFDKISRQTLEMLKQYLESDSADIDYRDIDKRYTEKLLAGLAEIEKTFGYGGDPNGERN